MPDLIIFDCDGVLVDSERIANHVLAVVLTELGFSCTEQEMLAYVGLADSKIYADLEARHGRAVPSDITDRYKQRLFQVYREKLRAIAGVGAVLDRIDHPTCVASSSDLDRVELSLQVTGLHDQFDGSIFTAQMVANGKPAPDLFLYAANRMQAAPDKCLVIEDSIAGVQAGCAAGMRVLGFFGGSHCPPDHGARLRDCGASAVFDDMRDLAQRVNS